MKIIPKKPTIDLERKLEEKLNKLKLRTELSIVELLSIFFFFLIYVGEKKTKGNTEEMNLKETNDFDSKMMVEEPQENLKYLEEEPLVLEVIEEFYFSIESKV